MHFWPFCRTSQFLHERYLLIPLRGYPKFCPTSKSFMITVKPQDF